MSDIHKFTVFKKTSCAKHLGVVETETEKIQQKYAIIVPLNHCFRHGGKKKVKLNHQTNL